MFLHQYEFRQFVWMLGPLHIEMMHLCVIGDWLDGSGLTNIYERSWISTPARIDSFLKGAFIERICVPIT